MRAPHSPGPVYLEDSNIWRERDQAGKGVAPGAGLICLPSFDMGQ